MVGGPNTELGDRLASQDRSAADMLVSFAERIERLTEEKAALSADIAEVFKDAKGAGFNVKILREVLKERAMDAGARQERETLLDLYRRALGVLADTPLGTSALAAAGKR